MTALPFVRLQRAARLVHPWIFSKSIVKPDARIPPGSVVDVQGPDGAFLGRGFYNGRARVAVRLLTLDPAEAIDRAFFARRLGAAVAFRRQLGLFEQTGAMRLCHAEGDLLPGLIIDLYNDIIAIQWFAAGMFRQREVIKDVLSELFPKARFYWFAEKRIQKQESFDCWDMEAPPPEVFAENGVKFSVKVGSMHKTGFFADQRDNRLLLASHCQGKRVLDLCCHTGGFAVYAATKGGASAVTGVDLDAEALTVARDNAALNGAAVDFVEADVFHWLRAAKDRGDKFDVVILDPAKQTRSADDIDTALGQYVAMNRLAMDVVREGGLLLSCSCSGLISEGQFLDATRRAAAHAGRAARVFRLSGAAPDHPFLLEAPESRYLKAVWMRL